MEATIQAKFNKQTKDSKKELVEFWVEGADENKPELSQMTREVVTLQLDKEGPEITCEFVSTSKDSKKTVLKFEVQGDKSAAKTWEFYKKAGLNVSLNIKESQMDIDDFREAQKQFREGLTGSIDKDGTVTVDPNQVTLEETFTNEEETKTPDDKPYVEVEKEQKPLTASQKKKLEKQKELEQQKIEDQKMINAQQTSDEDLPF